MCKQFISIYSGVSCNIYSSSYFIHPSPNDRSSYFHSNPIVTSSSSYLSESVSCLYAPSRYFIPIVFIHPYHPPCIMSYILSYDAEWNVLNSRTTHYNIIKVNILDSCLVASSNHPLREFVSQTAPLRMILRCYSR